MGKPIWNWASRPEASRHKEGDIFCENRQGFCRSSGTGAAAGRIAGGKQVFDSPPADRAFLLWMLAFTLLARGTSGALLPEVQLSTPAPNTITQSLTATGTIQWAAGSLFYLPEGLLVEAVLSRRGGCTGRRQNSGPPPGGCGTEAAEPSGRTCAETDGICPAYQTGGGGQL